MSAVSTIRAEIGRHGPIPFSRYQDLALYGPAGFYESGGAGRSRDFLTSPEVGPLFGAVVARRLDAAWKELARPDPFVVVEAGAGPGALAAAVLDARPECSRALRYVLVDRAQRQRERQGQRLALVPAAEAFAGSAEDGDDEPRPSPATGPLAVTLEQLPRRIGTGVILANELLDNLPVDLVERGANGWNEVRVGIDDDVFVEALVPAAETLVNVAGRCAPAARPGDRIPIASTAVGWLGDALDSIRSGRIIVFDYMRSSAELAALTQSHWLRTYRRHERGPDPLASPGMVDITCDVPIDQLAFVRPPDGVTDQRQWLQDNGIDELVAEGRATWHERAAVGDLQALQARSRIGEAEALTDPDGLGAFSVAEWSC